MANDSEKRSFTDAEIEIIRSVAELRGELNKTPSRFEHYTFMITMAGVLPALLISVVFFVLQGQQTDFERRVIEIIEEREAEQLKAFEKYLSAGKLGPSQSNN